MQIPSEIKIINWWHSRGCSWTRRESKWQPGGRACFNFSGKVKYSGQVKQLKWTLRRIMLVIKHNPNRMPPSMSWNYKTCDYVRLNNMYLLSSLTWGIFFNPKTVKSQIQGGDMSTTYLRTKSKYTCSHNHGWPLMNYSWGPLFTYHV